MVKRVYVEHKFKPAQVETIKTANSIINDYLKAGLRLTLRQLYYQFVSHHGMVNHIRSYKNLGRLISDARLAGYVDWRAIEDRGRVPDVPSEWDSIEELVDAAITQFRLPRWKGQDNYVELWVEKEALAGVLEPVAYRNHITLMANKGYSSQSAMYESAQRFLQHPDQDAVILYLGDLDPSGEDMVRDVEDRLNTFGVSLRVQKIALNMDQVEEYDPPPNPAKLTDSRAGKYVDKFGDSSWEVDALPPRELVRLIEDEIKELVDVSLMDEIIEEENAQRAKVRKKLKIKTQD